MPVFLLKLIALPRWAKGLGLIALAIAAFLIWDWFDDRAAIRDHEAEIAVQVQTKASEAASDATEAVVETKREVEAVNKRARDAAAKSADPLKAGLDAMGCKP